MTSSQARRVHARSALELGPPWVVQPLVDNAMANSLDRRAILNPPSCFTGRRQATALVFWLLLCYAAASLGGLASVKAASFFLDLQRPPWAPPAWLFGPVWSALYTLMGVSAWLVWRARGFSGARTALALFIGQLGVNALWTWLFFVWHQGGLAFAEIILLWLLILVVTIMFSRTSRLAAALLLPYLAWVTFAGVLTYSLWRLNPQLLG